MSPLPAPIRERHRPPIAKRLPANDHHGAWAGKGHVRAFLVQLSVLVLANLALWGFFAWMAIRYAERHLPIPPGGTQL